MNPQYSLLHTIYGLAKVFLPGISLENGRWPVFLSP